ncbi:MAG: polymer-forming cytoskeletal protein [Treponema sp.]|nr:polymer-forming cytoskeletal protein [Treponema sp.]MBQ7881486.1 polymer-forming cytoskeletal protein [Treponema sp.]
MVSKILSPISEDFSINTIIGLGSLISGDIRINGFIRIDGDVNGNIETTSNVLIGDKARIKGNINAASVVIGGTVLGDITAPKGIKLLSSSIVIGNLITKKVQIDDDVIFNGHCISLKNEEEFEKNTKKFLDQQAIRSRII